MTRGVPVLDPKRDLKGATPEKLAKALFRRIGPEKKAADACTPAAEAATVQAAEDEDGRDPASSVGQP